MAATAISIVCTKLRHGRYRRLNLPKLRARFVAYIIASIAVAALSQAANATCPYTFDTSSIVNGQTADATAVANNFNYIIQCPNFTGNVGIGSASPQATLDIGTPSGITTTNLRLSANAAPAWGFYTITRTDPLNGWGYTSYNENYGGMQTDWTYNGSSNTAMQLVGNNGANLTLYDGSNNPSIYLNSVGATFFTGGNVGIGTTSPDMSLSVNGNADKASGGTSWSVFSDRRLKDIQGTYDRGLGDIVKLQPIRFHYKQGNPLHLPSDTNEVGVVAQDVETVFPESVTKGRDGFLEFDMSPVQFAMINAIKELKADDDKQQAANAALTKLVVAQASELRALQAAAAKVEARLERLENERSARANQTRRKT